MNKHVIIYFLLLDNANLSWLLAVLTTYFTLRLAHSADVKHSCFSMPSFLTDHEGLLKKCANGTGHAHT